uniref:Uncharacterized protein n=1 Tax=Onchocerca volvulus TaxID=6282 RepID=A0A8R1TWN9_ONCVO
MNNTLLEKLSNCFPNVEILHMGKIERSSNRDNNEEEWEKTLQMLFEDESIFSKLQNFFVSDCAESNPKLPACKHPLNLLHVYDRTLEIECNEVVVNNKMNGKTKKEDK